MADDTELNSMTGGDVIASDDISGVKYQRVKIVEGADGTNDGDISATNPLPVAGVLFAIRDDTCDIRAASEGDYEPLHTDEVGRLWVDPQGNVAHDAGDSGNPVKIGAKVESTPSAQVCADADRTDLLADMDGALLIRETAIGDCLTERISNTNGTSTAAAVFTTGAGVRNVITDIIVYNSSATAGYVDFLDGSGGTILLTAPAPAGGGSVINLATPIKTTANTALYFDVSGALTTVYVTMVGFRTKIT